MTSLPLDELIDAVDRINKTLQSSTTDWAQVVANSLGVAVAAAIALLVAHGQHKRQIVHEVRREVAQLVTHSEKMTVPTLFILEHAKLGTKLWGKARIGKSTQEFGSRFDRHLYSLNETRDLISAHCETLYLIGTYPVQLQARKTQAAILAHSLEVLRVAHLMQSFVVESPKDMDFSNVIPETREEAKRHIRELQTMAVLLGLGRVNRIRMARRMK